MSDLKQNLEAQIQNCLMDKRSHAGLLALFAILENIGARKIHRFQRFEEFFSEDILSHAAEESRHALIFAKRYRQLTGQSLRANEHPVIMRSAKRYFRILDIQIGRLIQAQGIADAQKKLFYSYLLTTKIIEEQATIIYRTYESIIGSTLEGFTLKAILKDEERHLCQMNAQIDGIAVTLDETYYGSIISKLADEQQQMLSTHSLR